jgi:hypothetical protein
LFHVTGTAKLIFERLIKGPNALLSSTAVVLVTHASYLLNRVDKILIIVDGQNKFLGTWKDLLLFESPDIKTSNAINHIKTSVQEEDLDEAASENNSLNGLESTVKNIKDTNQAFGKLMTIEEREHGLSSITTWLLWFQRAGGVPFLVTQMLFLAVDRCAYVAVEWWLAKWTSGASQPIVIWGTTFPPQSDGRSAQYDYLRVYSTIILVSIIGVCIRSQWGVIGGGTAAKKVHASMLTRILGAPMVKFNVCHCSSLSHENILIFTQFACLDPLRSFPSPTLSKLLWVELSIASHMTRK